MAKTHTHTHTHTQCPQIHTGWMEPRATIGRNLDTCRPGLLLIKLMGYEHWEDALGGEQAMANTHTHSAPRATQGGLSLGQ